MPIDTYNMFIDIFYVSTLIMSNRLKNKVIDNIEVSPTIPQTKQDPSPSPNQSTNSQKQREKDGKNTKNNETKIRY